jgi:hypothetical protein
MKTLVNIFDPDEPLAAYLFLKQYYEEGDRLLFIATRENRQLLGRYAALFNLPDEQIEFISFKRDEDSYIYERISRKLQSHLSPQTVYWVNLAGGTRYLALAVQHVFSQFDARLFYVQSRENLIVRSPFDDRADLSRDAVDTIRYRMTMAEYFRLHGLSHDLNKGSHQPTHSEKDTIRVFDCFKARRLPYRAFEALELLRLHYRGTRRAQSIRDITFGKGRPFTDEETAAKRPPVRKAVPGLPVLLNALGFVPQEPDMLQPSEIDFLTGGWFEEYVYYTLLRLVSPQQIAIGVRIARPGMQHNNELDVVFIKANTLFVVECKTGVASDHMFNEIVYKASALKESFLGPSCHSYIFTLKQDYDHKLHDVAAMMGITLCPKGTLVSPELMGKVAEQMHRISNEMD